MSIINATESVGGQEQNGFFGVKQEPPKVQDEEQKKLQGVPLGPSIFGATVQ